MEDRQDFEIQHEEGAPEQAAMPEAMAEQAAPEQAAMPEAVAEQAALDQATMDEAATSFAGMLEESFANKGFRRGDIVEGVVVSREGDDILVDIGAKADAVISRRELEHMSAAEMSEVKVGASLLAYVLQPEDEYGNIVLSLRRAQMEKDWQEAKELMEAGTVLERQVVGFNKGGAIARIGKVRGFIPASQLSAESRQIVNAASTPGNEENAFAALVDKTLHLKIIEVDRKRNRLILSEREAMRDHRRMRKETLLSELQVGDARHGVVSSLCSFGAFVDLGGADGLIHISELSWGRVNDPSEVVHVGEEVDVEVLRIDRERNRIALSLKRLRPEPWTQVDDKYYVGQLVQGTITKLTDFGAFARLDNDIEGLVHISELSEERINHPKDVVKEGDVVTLRVIRIDSERRRLGLSKRRAQEMYEDAEFEDTSEEDLGSDQQG